MKKLFLIAGLFYCFSGLAQTGIGTTAPVNKIQVETILADPAISGNAANGNLRLSGTTGSHVLDFGLSSTSTFSWLQSRSRSAYGTNFNLVLNPNGGNVGIGNTSPNAKLDVRTNTTNNSDPGTGFIGIGTTTSAASSVGAGALRYSTTSGGILQYSNGNTWNTLTSNVVKSVVVARKLSGQSVTNGTATDISDWNEDVDVNGDFNSLTGRFIAPRNGNYNFTFNFAFAEGNYNVNTVIEAWMNCSNSDKSRKQLLAAPSGNPAGRCGAIISFTINLIAGESVWPTVWHNTGNTRNLEITGGNFFNNVSIVEL